MIKQKILNGPIGLSTTAGTGKLIQRPFMPISELSCGPAISHLRSAIRRTQNPHDCIQLAVCEGLIKNIFADKVAVYIHNKSNNDVQLVDLYGLVDSDCLDGEMAKRFYSDEPIIGWLSTQSRNVTLFPK